MEPYLRYLYTYVSISGPHLGYMYSSNSIFNSGLWLLKKIKGTQCIHQLTFTDDHDLENTFIYNLSKVLNAYYLTPVYSWSLPTPLLLSSLISKHYEAFWGLDWRLLVEKAAEQLSSWKFLFNSGFRHRDTSAILMCFC